MGSDIEHTLMAGIPRRSTDCEYQRPSLAPDVRRIASAVVKSFKILSMLAVAKSDGGIAPVDNSVDLKTWTGQLLLCSSVPTFRSYYTFIDVGSIRIRRICGSTRDRGCSLRTPKSLWAFLLCATLHGHHVYRVLSLTSEISFVFRPSRNLTAGITNGVVVGQKVTKFGIRTLQLGACPDNSGPHEKFNPGCSCTGPNLVETNLNEVEGIPTCIPSRRPSPTLSEFQVSTAVQHRPLGCKIYPRGPIRNF